jgi:hypothetical protein
VATIYPAWADGSGFGTPNSQSRGRLSSFDLGYRPANPNRVSFIPIGPEFIGLYDDNARAANMQSGYDTVLKCRFFQDHSQVLAVDGQSNGVPSATFARSSGAIARNGTNMDLGEPSEGQNVYSTAGSGGKGFKYDVYCDHPTISTPMGVWDAFDNTGSPAGNGSNCVGIIVARITVTVPDGGQINITTDESIGMVGRIMSFGFSQPVTQGIGSMGLSTVQSNYVQPQTKRYPAWGSTENGLHSFGTTSLHTMVWDAWPNECTLMLGQYFCPLHLFPNLAGTNADTEEPDQSVGTIINMENADDITMTTNTNLRGQLVTGGYQHSTKSIGAGDDFEIVRAGAGFKVGDILSSQEYGIEMRVASVDDSNGVKTATYVEEDGQKKRGSLDAKQLRGDNGFQLNFKSAAATKSCKIKWMEGIVYNETTIQGPKLRSYPKRVSIRGDGTIGAREGSKTTALSVDQNSDGPRPGAYDVFFFFHSDAAVNPRQYGFGNQTAIRQPIRHITVDIN